MKINEIFHSIQGEGMQIGVPTVFVRTTGCNLRCTWCDTKYAYEDGREMTAEDIMAEIEKIPTIHVCITGGEPLLWEEVPALISRLAEKGYQISVETNGSRSINELPCLDSLLISMDIKCPSSGMQDEMDFTNLELLGPYDQLKFIISNDADYNYAKEIIDKYKPICPIIMTPEGGLDIRTLAEKVLTDGLTVRVLPQLHKMIWGEKRGV